MRRRGKLGSLFCGEGYAVIRTETGKKVVVVAMRIRAGWAILGTCQKTTEASADHARKAL
jgi:hypothetical protein